MADTDAGIGEIQRVLDDLGLPGEVRSEVMALVRGATGTEPAPPDADLGLRVARTFCRTALRATEALGGSSLGMTVMLFDLFAAAEQGQAVSVSSLCIASGAAPTTALRQIGQLEARGFVTRQEDAQDRRRSWIRPTPRALELVRGLVEEWTAVIGG